MLHELSDDEQENEKVTFQQSPSLSTNDDLRELCLLLEQERNKMHELAEQWKEFGTTTIHKLECQIVDYQEKLIELEQRQMLLLKENQALKSLTDQLIIQNDNPTRDKKSQQNISTQTNFEKHETSHHHSSCFHRPKPISNNLSHSTSNISMNKLTRQESIDDPLQQQISIQNMFDAIKTAEVYDSIDDMDGESDESEKKLLKEFCNLVWKYLEDRSKPKSSFLL